MQELLALQESFELVIYSLKGAREDIAHSEVASLRAQVFYQDPALDFHSQEQVDFCLSRIPKIDLVYAHFLHDPALFGMKVAAALAVPLVCSAHAVDIYTTDKEKLALVIQAARRIFVCHRHGYNYLCENFPEACAIFTYLPHGINCEYFLTRESVREVNHFLSVGRLVEKKGYPLILRALARFKHDGSRFRYTIIGEGRERENLCALTRELGLQENVRFLGALKREEVKDYYSKCSALLLAPMETALGDRDGVPNVLLEAMASGLPVITRSLAGLEEITIPGKTAQVFEDGEEALTLELEKFGQSDCATRKLQCERARQLVCEQFDSSVHLANLRNLLGQELS